MKNIENVYLDLVHNVDYNELYSYCNIPIPDDFKPTCTMTLGKFAISILPIPLSIFGWPYNANEISLTQIKIKFGTVSNEEAYLRYVPNIIKSRLKQALPYPEAVSCNEEGIIKIVHYKKFSESIKTLLKRYCYELISEEPFENKNNEPVVIQKYRLKVEEVEEKSTQ